LKATLLLVAFCAWSVTAHARTPPTGPRAILVVVSSANPTAPLTVAQLRRIFLREVTIWSNGWPISVFERSTDHQIRTTFSLTVLGKTPAQLSEYWLGLALTRGLDPPKLCRTSSLLQQYLERVKGGIGYVYEDELETGMTIVARVFPKSDR
jgi:ABC-type phosphate transport system substrate-binding protein